MTKKHVYAALYGLLAMTAPWFFAGDGSAGWWGLPTWAVYSLLATLSYALFVAVALHRSWDLSLPSPPEGDEPAARDERGR